MITYAATPHIFQDKLFHITGGVEILQKLKEKALHENK